MSSIQRIIAAQWSSTSRATWFRILSCFTSSISWNEMYGERALSIRQTSCQQGNGRGHIAPGGLPQWRLIAQLLDDDLRFPQAEEDLLVKTLVTKLCCDMPASRHATSAAFPRLTHRTSTRCKPTLFS